MGTRSRGAVAALVSVTCIGAFMGCGHEPAGRLPTTNVDRVSSWCAQNLTPAAREGAGLESQFLLAMAWGEPGREPRGVMCGYRGSSLAAPVGDFAMGLWVAASDTAARQVVTGDAESPPAGVDEMSGSYHRVSRRYTLFLRAGHTVIRVEAANCRERTACRDIFVGMAGVLLRSAGPPTLPPCAGDDGEPYRALPLRSDAQERQQFALADESGRIRYVVTAGAGGLAAEVLSTMDGREVSADEVETVNQVPVSVSGVPVITNAGRVRAFDDLLTQHWAVRFRDGLAGAAVASGESSPPELPGRIILSRATPCVN